MSNKMRYNDDELAVIKGSFAENEDLILALRKAFLQAELTQEEEKQVLAIAADEKVMAVVAKTLAPKLDANAPMFQQADLYVGMQFEFGSPEKVEADMAVRKILADYMYSMVEIIGTPAAYSVTMDTLTPSGSTHEDAINLAARDKIISHVDFQLNQLLVLAGQKDETVETTRTRLQKDSAR